MSAVAAWSLTATATLWALSQRDAWSGAPVFDAPVQIACDYASDARLMRDSLGDEFTTREVIYTERADIKPGDRILIGASTAADPIAAGAREVRAVKRDADTFGRAADDYTVGTV